jgi:hypothetical protein
MSALGPVLAVSEQMLGGMWASRRTSCQMHGSAFAMVSTHPSMSRSRVSRHPNWARWGHRCRRGLSRLRDRNSHRRCGAVSGSVQAVVKLTAGGTVSVAGQSRVRFFAVSRDALLPACPGRYPHGPRERGSRDPCCLNPWLLANLRPE